MIPRTFSPRPYTISACSIRWMKRRPSPPSPAGIREKYFSIPTACTASAKPACPSAPDSAKSGKYANPFSPSNSLKTTAPVSNGIPNTYFFIIFMPPIPVPQMPFQHPFFSQSNFRPLCVRKFSGILSLGCLYGHLLFSSSANALPIPLYPYDRFRI